MKKFTKINDPFICENCNSEVLPTQNDTYRNHCPKCLHSKHVDHNPGDRANNCQGTLSPTGLEKRAEKFYLLFKCNSCKEETRNIMALKTSIQPDDFDLAIRISVRPRV